MSLLLIDSFLFLLLLLLLLLSFFRIQFTRHLHDKVKTLEVRTAPPKEEQQGDNSGLGLGGAMMLNETLMLTNAPAYGSK
jgi:hypothetical protein